MAFDLVSTLAIFVLAFAYSTTAILLSNQFGGRRRLKHVQSQMQQYQKEIAHATRERDEKKLKALQLREAEITGYMMEMMWLPWKSAVFVLPVFFIIVGTNGFLGISYHGILAPTFPGFSVQLPFEIHYSSLLRGFSFNPLSWLQIFSNIAQPATYGVRGFFIVCAILSGIVAEAVITRIENRGKPPAAAHASNA